VGFGVGWKRLTEDMVRKGAVEELEGSGNERNLESMSKLAGGETILSRLISREVLLGNVVSWLMTGMRDGGVCGKGEGSCGEAVGEGEERAEFKKSLFHLFNGFFGRHIVCLWRRVGRSWRRYSGSILPARGSSDVQAS
jgi:hypothetical protein